MKVTIAAMDFAPVDVPTYFWTVGVLGVFAILCGVFWSSGTSGNKVVLRSPQSVESGTKIRGRRVPYKGCVVASEEFSAPLGKNPSLCQAILALGKCGDVTLYLRDGIIIGASYLSD